MLRRARRHATSLRCSGMWNTAPMMSIMDGPDEVHQVTVSKNIFAGYKPHEGLFPTEYLPHKRHKARREVPANHRRRPRAPGVSRSRRWTPTPAGEAELGILDGHHIALTGGHQRHGRGVGAFLRPRGCPRVLDGHRRRRRVHASPRRRPRSAVTCSSSTATSGRQARRRHERGIAWLGGLDVLANVAGIERGATPKTSPRTSSRRRSNRTCGRPSTPTR